MCFIIVKMSIAFEGLSGSTQITPVGFLSKHWQRWHHASPCCWLQEGSAGFQIHFNLLKFTESVTFAESTALMNFSDTEIVRNALSLSSIIKSYCQDQRITAALNAKVETFYLTLFLLFCCVKTWQQSSIPLDRYHIEELIQRLDRDRTGMVDYRWACLILYLIILIDEASLIASHHELVMC